MNEGLDTGDIISRKSCPIGPKETGGSLFAKLAVLGAELLVETLPSIENGTASFTPQPEKSTTPYARQIKKEMGGIDWTEDAALIERKIRAYSPWPSAYTRLDGRMLKIWEAHIEKPDHIGANPGTIVRQDAHGIYIETGRGILCPDVIQIEGKRKMTAEEFLRGYVIRSNRLG